MAEVQFNSKEHEKFDDEDVDIAIVVKKLKRKPQTTSGQVDQKKHLGEAKDGER